MMIGYKIPAKPSYHCPPAPRTALPIHNMYHLELNMGGQVDMLVGRKAARFHSRQQRAKVRTFTGKCAKLLIKNVVGLHSGRMRTHVAALGPHVLT